MQIEIGKEGNTVYNKSKKNVYSQISQGPLKQDSGRIFSFLLKAESVAWGFSDLLSFSANIEYIEIWNNILSFFFVYCGK